ALTVLILIWPIVLPSGLLWLALYWSILLWGYGSSSERGVLIGLWLLLGLIPGVLSLQQRSAQIALVPASRLVDNLAEERLYGSLFSDLEVLRSLVPDSDTVTEIVADLHRRLGQWEYARAIYTELSQDPERPRADTAAAFSNIGVYFYRRGEYETAVNYFARSIDADPSFAEGYFNLSRGHGQLYEFNEQHEAMARAKALAGAAADEWNDAVAALAVEESSLPVDGGLRRVGELRTQIDDLWRRRDTATESWQDLLRRWQSLGVALVALIFAIMMHRLRGQMGHLSDRLPAAEHPVLDNRWVRLALPGLDSLRDGRGLRAFIAILLPVGLIMASFVRGLGYRTPLAMDPGHWLATAFAVIALVILYLVRAGVSLTD
ncbi:MAG: tetratricopeptide repeat protein, partial [Acidobacteriota bacterium]